MKKQILCLIIFLFSYPLFSQNLSVFNVDASAFPNVKAYFFAFDASWKQQSPDKNEVIIKENGLTRTVINVTCPYPSTPTVISSVLITDVSNTMNGRHLDIAKAAASAWVNSLPDNKSECAISTFDHFNYFNRDFTTDKTKLLKSINDLSAGGGTNYNKALMDPMASGLATTKTGKFEKVIVLMIDGLSNTVPETVKIIAEAKNQRCKIFVVALDMKCPKELQDIASQTGGEWFEDVKDADRAIEIYHTILHIAQGGEPCSILWKSVPNCDTADINLEMAYSGLKATTIYPTPSAVVHKLEVEPKTIGVKLNQLGIYKDTTIKLAAKDGDIKITAINLKFGSTAFAIKNITFPITIPKNTNYNIPIRFTPTDSNMCYSGFEIITDYCPASFSCTGGFEGKPIKNQSLRLTHPNGGNFFVAGIDTLITWDGVMPSDIVTLEYSIDGGITWIKITDNASGLKYRWKDVPKPASKCCLVRVSYGITGSEFNFVWEKTYGGSLNETCQGLQQTTDGGFILIGRTTSKDGDLTENKGKDDFWIVKVNSMGIKEWQKSLGGSKVEYAYSVQQTKDGGYIVGGDTESSDGDVVGHKGGIDIWIVKFKQNGELEWKKTYGGSGSDASPSIKLTPDGGYIVAATTGSSDGDVAYNHGSLDLWVFKLSSTGNIEWQKTYGGSSSECANDIQLTKDGGFIIAGNNMSTDGDCNKNNGSPDFWIVKLNAIGAIQWQYSFGGSSQDVPHSIQQTQDGGYIVAGDNYSSDGDATDNHGYVDAWILKLSSIGQLEWKKAYGGSLGDIANSIFETIDGGYIFGGYAGSIDGDLIKNTEGLSGSWLVKLNSNGSIESQKILNQTDTRAFEKTKDGGFILGGRKYPTNYQSDFWIGKIEYKSIYNQSSKSLVVFSIVEPTATASDIDLKNCLLGSVKDTTIMDFIKNTGKYKFTVDSIYFRGKDAGAFSLVSAIPQYVVGVGEKHQVEIRFIPTKEGAHNAEMVIITQADTLVQNIKGEGVQPQLEILNELINFGKVMVGSFNDTSQVYTIKNISTKPITITSTNIKGPNVKDFSILSDSESFVLEPEDVRMIDLRFHPSDVGRTSGILALYYEGVGSPVEIQLYGEGLLGMSQELLAPRDASINLSIDCLLNWKKNVPNCSYLLQVSKDENFSQLVVNTTISDTFYKCSKLDFLHTYHWRVKAVAGSEQSSWSPFWRFTTLMDSVNLNSPKDLSKNIELPVNLTWSKGIYKRDYRLQISKENEFNSVDLDSLVASANNSDVKNLKYYSRYFWRIRNESGDTLGYWSDIWQFETAMSKLLLVYPENNQSDLEEEINFKWSDVAGAEYYQLQISKNDQFTDLVYSKDSLTTTERFVPNLEPQMLYYWRVRVWNTESIGTAYWSDTWQFTTGGTGVIDKSSNITIIPNPAGDYITINLKPFKGFESLEGCAIHIYNALGECIMAVGNNDHCSLRVNISHLPKGIYFVKVGGETVKFVKI